MKEIYENKYSFLEISPKHYHSFKALIVIFIIALIISLNKIFIYDTFRTKGFYICENTCYLKAFIPTNILLEKIIINNKEVQYEIINKELKINEEEMISYYELFLSVDFNLNDNEIIDITFYYNKQRMIDKLVELVFKRR